MSELRRAVGRRVARPLRALRHREPASVVPPAPPGERLDDWLGAFFGAELERLDAAVAGAGAEALARFRGLDDELWALLLTQEYDAFPNIRALLPDVPDPALQRVWNGVSGVELAAQSAAFVRRLRARFAAHGAVALGDARVLDFGCGWGRLTRQLARDVAPGRLCGCDPVEAILDECRRNRVPAALARTDFVPERLPFDEPFDLAYAFSVFTHLSERAHAACLRALHAALAPGAILVVTVRSPAYLRHCALMHPVLDARGPDAGAQLAAPRYLFVAHPPEPSHLQYAGGEMTYGETVVTPAYVREHWAPAFELLGADLLLADLHQVVLTLRRSA